MGSIGMSPSEKAHQLMQQSIDAADETMASLGETFGAAENASMVDIDGPAHATVPVDHGKKQQQRTYILKGFTAINKPGNKAACGGAGPDGKLAVRRRLPDASPPHKSWKPAPTNSTSCDICGHYAFGTTVQQRCQMCAVVVCRRCVEDGRADELPNHAPVDSRSLDWGKMRPVNHIFAFLHKCGVNQSDPTSESDAQDGDFSADDTDDTNDTDDSHVATAQLPKLLPRSAQRSRDPPSTPPAQILKTPTSPPSLHTIRDSEEDDDDDEDYIGHTNIINISDSDEEYHPPGQMNQKRSAPFPLASPRTKTTKRSRCSDATDAALPVMASLANTRPVRAAAIKTYEKMRSTGPNVKTEAEFELDKLVHAPAKMRAGRKLREESVQVVKPAQKALNGAHVYEHDIVNGPGKSYITQNGVSFKPMDFDAGIDFKNEGDATQQNLAAANPDGGSNSQGYAAAFNKTLLPAAQFKAKAGKTKTGKIKTNGTVTTATQQGTTANPFDSSTDEDGSNGAQLVLRKHAVARFHRSAERIAARAQRRLQHIGGNDIGQHLRDAAAFFWTQHRDCRYMRSVDEGDAFVFLVAHLRVAQKKLDCRGHRLLEHWIESTGAPFDLGVGNDDEGPDSKIPKSIGKLSHLSTAEDIRAANALLELSKQ